MMTYEEQVKVGKEIARRDAQVMWDWADLFLEVFPIRKRGRGGHGPQGDSVPNGIARFCMECGYPRKMETAASLRKTARQWPKSKRVKNTSFSAHVELRNHPERFKLLKPGMTSGDAKRIMGRDVMVPFGCTSGEAMEAGRRWLESAARKLEEEGGFQGVHEQISISEDDLFSRLRRIEEAVEQVLEASGVVEVDS